MKWSFFLVATAFWGLSPEVRADVLFEREFQSEEAVEALQKVFESTTLSSWKLSDDKTGLGCQKNTGHLFFPLQNTVIGQNEKWRLFCKFKFPSIDKVNTIEAHGKWGNIMCGFFNKISDPFDTAPYVMLTDSTGAEPCYLKIASGPRKEDQNGLDGFLNHAKKAFNVDDPVQLIMEYNPVTGDLTVSLNGEIMYKGLVNYGGEKNVPVPSNRLNYVGFHFKGQNPLGRPNPTLCTYMKIETVVE